MTEGDITYTTRSTTLTLGYVGPFVDWFLVSMAAFSSEDLLGLTALAVESPADDDGGTGQGGQLFLDYDFRVSREWSLGGLLTLLSSANTIKDNASDLDLTLLSLQFSALFHRF